MDVLQLDVSGRPQAWITLREAALLYACDGVAWTLGRAVQVLRGGIQRTTGLQSRIEVHAIIAVRGAIPSRAWRVTPTLTNPKLFVRDRIICKAKSYSSIPIQTCRPSGRGSAAFSPNRTIRACTRKGTESPRISGGPGAPSARPPQPVRRTCNGNGGFAQVQP